jgi:hemolysin III
VMGWAAVAVTPQIYRGGGAVCFLLIVIGGVAYTLGAIFLGLKRPRLWPRTFGPHELFHALTLVGAGCHFAAVYLALK